MTSLFNNKVIIIILALMIIAGVSLLFFSTSVPNFSDYPAGKDRKKAFFNYFAPLINDQNQVIAATRQQVERWYKNKNNIGWWEQRKLTDITLQYRIKNFTVDNDKAWQRLLNKVDVLPPSLVLAQAANESAWGTSRFAKSANNYFGQWCFTRGCGLVPKKRDSGKAHEVAAFSTPNDSLKSYMLNLNSHPAYSHLRDIRAQRRKNNQPITGDALAAGLTKYSERAEEYIEELRAMIRFNQLNEYDQKAQLQ